MNLETIEKIVQEIDSYLNKGSVTEQDIRSSANLAYKLYNKYKYRPIFPGKQVNDLIGRKESHSKRETINESFFMNTNRIKYLLEYVRIKPLLNIMKRDYFNLPQERDSDFLGFIKGIFSDYLGELHIISKSHSIIEDNLDEIDQLCGAILKSISKYYDGFPSLSYDVFDKAMEIVTQHTLEFYDETQKLPAFRMRVGGNHLFNRKEMFHIPFELRGIVSTQRYSIPGLPCLYLGSSSFVCWEEMNRPDLNTVQTSMFAFKTDKKTKLLNLGYPPNVIRELVEENLAKTYGSDDWNKFINALAGYFVMWPLIASISIRVLNRNDDFKPEYIIPQLLLQWVRLSPKYDGVCYFSIAAKSLDRNNFHLFQNYALPIKERKFEGHCERLKEHFWVTDAVSWQLFQIYKHSGEGFDTEDYQVRNIEPIIGSKVNYVKTDFAKLESFLMKQKAKSIT